ncbi:MAG: SDR family oxidoreductase [Ardenticatenaceae bacterium]|nr:SDR family oxidoreductase [Ardenticatenaceae bacterium]MCB9443311.1 SDR family oxidoreductase [Ardenticatenaceae bacterium]
MDLGLKDKVALVVASSTGLGFAAALELAKDGAKVVVCGRSQDSLDTAVARIKAEVGGDANVVAFTTDVTDLAQNEKLIADTVARFGGLDILITNAGGPPGGTFDSLDLDAWDKAYNLTLMSAVRLIKLALPHLRQSQAASVLTVTSISLKQPIAGLLLSNVMRPAVAGVTKTLSQELGPENIRVNSILPGWTATDRVNHIFEYRAQQNGTDMDTEKGKITATIPMGRMADPAEFGRVAAFLVSPAASYITGAMIPVDGGSYAGLL